MSPINCSCDIGTLEKSFATVFFGVVRQAQLDPFLAAVSLLRIDEQESAVEAESGPAAVDECVRQF